MQSRPLNPEAESKMVDMVRNNPNFKPIIGMQVPRVLSTSLPSTLPTMTTAPANSAVSPSSVYTDEELRKILSGINGGGAGHSPVKFQKREGRA